MLRGEDSFDLGGGWVYSFAFCLGGCAGADDFPLVLSPSSPPHPQKKESSTVLNRGFHEGVLHQVPNYAAHLWAA